MKANRIILVAALAAGSLLLGNPVLLAADTNKPASTPPVSAPPPRTGGFERMAERLSLTAEQKPKVQATMEAQQQKMLDLRNNTALAPEEKRAKRLAVVEETSQQMKAILTPEQFETWQKISPMAGHRPHPGGPAAGGQKEKAGSTNAPPPPPKK
jgi:Spy/CpxP family protein refolding chaperone